MVRESELTRRLHLRVPIIQAPMAGGATTVELVAAVCEAGALGFFGAAYLKPEQIAAAARELRTRTARPFGINLFAPLPALPPDIDAGPALALLGPIHEELGLPPPQSPPASTEDFGAQLAAVLDSGAAVFSFTFGIPPEEALRAVRARGLAVFGTATTVDEALALQAAGVDAVVAQGSDAGAHRGTFAVPFEQAMVGTMSLVPQVVDAVRVPVIASGGIMDGRGIAAALVLGAAAVQMGTAFLVCEEAGIAEAHRSAILTAREHETRITRAFSGRPARGIVNRFMIHAERPEAPGAILPYPLQNTLTRPMRSAAAKAGRAEYLSLWTGQGVRLARRLPAGELVALLAQETEQAARRLTDPAHVTPPAPSGQPARGR